MKKVILISGKKRHGKDQFAEYLIDVLKEFGVARRYAFADELKNLCQHMFPLLTHDHLYGDKKEDVIEGYNKTPRQILQDVGVYCRSVDDNYWVTRLQNYIYDEIDWAIIPDLRFPNEMKNWKHPIMTVRVERPDIISNDEHISETLLDNYEFDIYIKNDGTLDDLRQKAHTLCTMCLLENVR